MKRYLVFIFLLLANLFWAGNYVFGKYLVEEMSPLQMTFSRWFIALLILLPIAHFVERPNWKLVLKEWKTLILLATLGILSYNFLLYEALQYTTSMNAALVNSMNPALLVLFSVLFLKERLSMLNCAGLFISLLGVLLVLTNGKLQYILQTSYNKGDLIMLLAILVWTIYSLIGRKTKTIPPISATSLSVLFALIMMIPVMFMTGTNFTLNLSNLALTGIFYMGIFPSVGSFIFWNVSLRYLDASKAGIYLNLITVFTAIISVVLGNSISTIQIIGGMLVFCGVYLTSRRDNQLLKKTNLHQICNEE